MMHVFVFAGLVVSFVVRLFVRLQIGIRQFGSVHFHTIFKRVRA